MDISRKNKTVFYVTKQVFDIIAGCILLVCLSPLLLVIAVAVRSESGSPIIYRHKRVGKYGKTIYVIKFRSMVNNADGLIGTFTDEQQEEWLAKFRLDNDPRVTRVGRMLRAHKLDELPQLVNVIRGDMSLVGPRPITEAEVQLYGENREKLLSVLPGLTGYWQAYAADDCTYEERMKMELDYVDHANALWDLRILFATIRKLIPRKRAED